MNRRKVFGMLAAVPAMAVLVKAAQKTPLGWWQPGQYVPPMRETGQWSSLVGFWDEDTGESYATGYQYMVRHDVAFTDQNGDQHHYGFDHCFDHEPTREDLAVARETVRYRLKRMLAAQKANTVQLLNGTYSSPAREALIPVGPSTQFKLLLPPGLKHALYV